MGKEKKCDFIRKQVGYKAKFYLPEYGLYSCGQHLNQFLRERIELPKDKKVIVEVLKGAKNNE